MRTTIQFLQRCFIHPCKLTHMVYILKLVYVLLGANREKQLAHSEKLIKIFRCENNSPPSLHIQFYR
jgi:hypothetical protein